MSDLTASSPSPPAGMSARELRRRAAQRLAAKIADLENYKGDSPERAAKSAATAHDLAELQGRAAQ